MAAYCRVSSLSEEQLKSYEAQVDHYRTMFENDDSVEFAGVYTDAGISGTQSATREGFMRMIEDCRAGKIDRIQTKSVSRFGRNTEDTLIYTRELRALGIDVFFEKEKIHTTDAKGEMLLTLMAAYAESESENLSENIKWGKRRRFEQGLVEVVNISKMLGFHQNRTVVTIMEDEAEIVRRIYSEYLDGYNMNEIALRLEADGVDSKNKCTWSGAAVRNILTNEKYAGDCLFQKTYSADPIGHRIVPNRGELTQYLVEGCYPAIIEKDVWLVVQEMIRRYNASNMNSKEFSPFAGKIFCSVCGKKMRIFRSFGTERERLRYYRCLSANDHSGVEVPGMTFTPPHKANYKSDVTYEFAVYREKYYKKSVPRPLLCSDIKVGPDLPAEAFVRAWNYMLRHRKQYLQTLQGYASDSEDIVWRYHSGVLYKLVEAGEKLSEFDGRLFRKTVEKVEVLPTGKLTYVFKAGIRVTV